MITKINKLKRFGIYQDYTWGGIDDFKKKNLVYGWNYSGKTTLSKLFQVLEFKDKNRCFGGSEIEVTCDDGLSVQIFNQDRLDNFPFEVKVFNSEYINRIFTWDQPKSGFSAISFYLGDAAEAFKEKIEKLETINERLTNLRDNRYIPITNTFDSYNKPNGIFTSKAKDIRDNYLPGIFNPTTFDKGDLKAIVDQVKSDFDSFVLSESERNKTKVDALAVNKYERLDEKFNFSEGIIELAKEVKNILDDTAPKSISFPELEDDVELFNWVQKGIILHIDSTECKFCTKSLPNDRIENLNSFYSKKLVEIQSAINNALKSIEEEKKAYEIKFPNKKDIAETYQLAYESALAEYEVLKNSYKEKLSLLKADLSRKSSNIFIPIVPTEIDLGSLKDPYDKIQGIIDKHNEWFDQFAKRKQTAIEKILKHYVAEYLKSEKYIVKEKAKIYAESVLLRVQQQIEGNLVLIKSYREKLSSTAKGQGELNDTLEILLHRDDIKIEIQDEKFTLERSKFPAEHLSEGEKSAIAFSYFLTELKALRKDEPPKLPKTIIFIDDPISSLDSNHIFQVRSLLKDFFKTDDFAQLFISTHNFEFFSIMYDSGIFSRKQDELKRPLYFIKRDKNGVSTIEKMPKSFSNYKSEYVGLFHILKEFDDSVDKDNFAYLLLLPNALRRFVELYTLTKYPANNDSTVDKRVELIFKSDEKSHHNIKLLNWFSHQNQIEKVQQHDEKLLQIKDAIHDLMEYLKKQDVLHWKGLNGL